MQFTFHLTTDCNMRCSYCYAPPQAAPVMSEETACKAVEYAAELNPERCGIVLFGGEPLLHKDRIRAIVTHARAIQNAGGPHFSFKLTTNGVLLDETFMDYAVAEDILIALSIDGGQRVHDRHRRLAGGGQSFERVHGGLRRLLVARPFASVLAVINPDTAEDLCDSVSFLLDEGCRYLILSLNHAATWTDRDFRRLDKQYRKLAKLYIQWTREGRKFYLSPFEVKLSSHINGHRHHKDRCELAQRQLSVDAEGHLYPCVQFPQAGSASDWCIGHIDRGIDLEAQARISAASQADKEFCRDCAIAARCNNTCGCLNWQTTGSINEISPVLCRNEQILVRCADEIGKTLYKERDPLFLHKHYNDAYPMLSLLEETLKRSPDNPSGCGQH